jgi:hypothetical protein
MHGISRPTKLNIPLKIDETSSFRRRGLKVKAMKMD